MELWLCVEVVARTRQPVLRRSVGNTEQRTTIKIDIKTIRRTNTRVGTSLRRNASVELVPICTTGHLWGSNTEFSLDSIHDAKRYESPKGPIKALINQYNQSSY